MDKRNNEEKKKIVLFFPNLAPEELRPYPLYWNRIPLPILSLARMFNQEEYTVTLIDAKWEDDVETRVVKESKGAVCFAVSAIIGYQLLEGIKLSRAIKNAYPDIPVVWGGWFPSVKPEMTIAKPYIDFVVRGQGELTFLELVESLVHSKDIKGVQGITYKDGDKTVSTPARALEDINKFPMMPYHLLDIDKYVSKGGDRVRHINILTSVGCPYQCKFCADNIVYNKKWLALTAERVVEEIELLINKWGVTHFQLDDPSFFISETRTRQICQMIIEKGIAGKFLWYATGNADRVARLDNDLLCLIRKSGGAQIFIGAESGSPLTLQALSKKITVDDILNSVEKLKRHNITALISFVVGSPVEEDEALDKTINLCYKIIKINPQTQFYVNFFSPIPGIDILNLPDVKKVFKEPTELEEWAPLEYGRCNFSFKSKGYLKKVLLFRYYLGVSYKLNRLSKDSKNRIFKKIFSVIKKIPLYRLRYNCFNMPVAIYLSKLYRVLFRTSRTFSLDFMKEKSSIP